MSKLADTHYILDKTYMEDAPVIITIGASFSFMMKTRVSGEFH